MNKYQSLYDFLSEKEESQWNAQFCDVEKVLGFSLPKSARVYRAWWGNQKADSGHSHSMSWANAGWKTCQVNILGERLTFIKTGKSQPLISISRDQKVNSRITVQDRIVGFLREQPSGATTNEIAMALDRSPSHIYQEASLLERQGLITSHFVGRAKQYSIAGSGATNRPDPDGRSATLRGINSSEYTPRDFEDEVREILSLQFETEFSERTIGRIPKKFDFVSADESIVGDAKYYTLVRGQSLPPAKFATIAEYVWLLEKTNAKTKLLVFGNDRRVPLEWLRRYGELVEGVQFYFLNSEQELEILN